MKKSCGYIGFPEMIATAVMAIILVALLFAVNELFQRSKVTPSPCVETQGAQEEYLACIRRVHRNVLSNALSTEADISAMAP